jgi:hypothetical protein
MVADRAIGTALALNIGECPAKQGDINFDVGIRDATRVIKPLHE